jgi:hypothetical protein
MVPRGSYAPAQPTPRIMPLFDGQRTTVTPSNEPSR